MSQNKSSRCMSDAFRRSVLVLAVGLAVFAMVAVAPGTSGVAGAAGTTKVDLGGYDGPDAKYVANLAEPVVKPGFKFKAGFLQPNASINVLLEMQKSMEKKVKQLGGELIAFDSGLDVQKQVSQMNQLISMKVDVIFVFPMTDASMVQGIKTAKAKGIKVVLVNTPASSTTPMDPNAITSVSIAVDYYDYCTMKYVADKMPGAKVAFMGYGGPSEMIKTVVGRMDYWGKKLGLKILGSVDALNDNPSAYTVAAQAIVGKYPDVQVIMTYNDYSQSSTIAVLKASGKTNVKVGNPNGGQDIAAPGLRDGSVICAYRNPWEKVGEQAAIAGYDILTNQNLPLPKRVLVPGVLATKENVDSVTFIK